MKRLKRAFIAFWSVITADKYFIATVKGNLYDYIQDIDINTLNYIVKECIDDAVGEYAALRQAKEILNRIDQNEK